MTINVHTLFDPDTATFTHIVHELTSKNAAIIDSVLNYDQYSGRTSTQSCDAVIQYIKQENLSVQWILETHIHADHITGSHYLKEKIGGKIGIGSKIKEVLDIWIPIFNTSKDTPYDGSQFDYLFEDEEIIKLGSSNIKVIHTPGHTPACVSYLIEDSIFTGDTIFMPDIGTARTDFPGGNASIMYDSIQKILSLPDETKIYIGHDYPPQNREATFLTTINEQTNTNILVRQGISKEEYVSIRNERDQGKAVPKLLLPSIQANMRAGALGLPEENNIQYIKIPIDKI